MKNDFLDNIIKDKLNQQEYEFSAADWNSFEKKRGNTSNVSPNTKWFLGGAAAAVVIAVASYVWLSDIENSNENISNQELVEINGEDKTQNVVKPINNDNNDVNTVTNENEPIINNENLAASNSNIENNVTPEDHQEDQIENNGANLNNSDSDHQEPLDNSTNQADETTEQNSNNNAPKEIAVPSAIIMAEKMEICPGDAVSFETIEQENVMYSWNLGDDTYSSERIVTHEYTKPGKYPVSLIVTSTLDHSVLSKSKDVLIEVLPAPSTSFEVTYLEDEIIPSVSVASKETLDNYYWDFGNGTHSSEASPSVSYKKKGYYNITLLSTNMEGCTAKTTQKITIKEDYNLLAPNSFTPNGDGINDYFIPEALKLMDCEFTMSIFSKTDGLIFESKNINQQWDGRNQQNGQNCIEDTYIWVVALTTKEGKSEHYKGAVLLLK